MENKEKSVNRKAIPKFFGILFISALIGGVLGGVFISVDTIHLIAQMVAVIYIFLEMITPWAILFLSVLFLGIGFVQYHTSRKLFQSWDGESEEIIDKAEEKLSWGLLLSGLNVVVDFFFFGIGFRVVSIENTMLEGVWLVSFILSFVCIVVLQQKIVDLTRKMNPEKQGSIYDSKFHKKWVDSCDENEQRQMGQAAYKAFRAVNITCVILWGVLILLAFIFDIGILPFFLVTLIFGVSQTVYVLECIRLGLHKN